MWNVTQKEGFESAVQNACQVFGVEKLFSEQFKALKTFVSGIDVLINLTCQRDLESRLCSGSRCSAELAGSTISDKIVDTFTLLTPYFVTVIHFLLS